MTTSNTITKNDLASVLNNVLPIQGTDLTQAGIEAFLSGLDAENLNGNVHFSSICTSVTLPFTPSTNGLLLTEMRANSASRTYVTYSNATPGIVDGVLGAGTYCTGVSFVTKGNQVTQTDSYNLQDIQWHFVPLDIKLSSEREISTEADWVVEDSSNSNWKWRKWASGKVEAWYSNAALTISATNTQTAVLPHTPTSIINLQVNGTGNGFMGQVYHCWVPSDKIPVVSASTSGSYQVWIYIVYTVAI